MIHFRLRRSLRLVLHRLSDFLSFTCGARLIGLRAALLAPRGAIASVAALTHPAAFTSLDHSSRLFSEPRRPRMDPVGGRGRYPALIGLLTALSLEACGCNLVGNFVRGSNLTSDAFIGVQGGDSVRVDQAPTFYDPAYDPAEQDAVRSSSALAVDDLFLGPRPALSEAKSAPWAIPESVYFIYRGRRPGDFGPRQPPLATAFVLAVPSLTGRNPNQLLRFLVTARHVLDPEWAHCADSNPATVDLRLNRREGGLGYETISLRDGATPQFLTPADPTADLAIIPLNNALIANLDDYKLLDVPFRLLLTSSEMPLLHFEQPVMTAGLSTQPAGGPGSFPVFNAGSLAKMPAEAIDVRCGTTQPAQSPATLLHVWYIDAGLPQGVSGAPVFTSIARRPGTEPTPVLLGIQSVVWPDRGMAGITPSPILGDLIRSVVREQRTSTRRNVVLKSGWLSASKALSQPSHSSATGPRGIQIH